MRRLDGSSSRDETGKRKDNGTDGDREDGGARKRRRIRHKVVIHSSPFLRCLQTSVAIAAGMAQYNPIIETGAHGSHNVAGKRAPNQLHSASPRVRATEGVGLPSLAAIAEPKHDFAHAIARKVLHEHHRHRKSKLRVDAFLGEWLNPQYFDNITPPPPSAMMVAIAKAELMQNEAVEIFTPSASSKTSTSSSLWGGGVNGSRDPSREATLDDWSHVQNSLPSSPTRRDRASSQSSVGSNDSERKSPFRPGVALQMLTSTLPKQESAIYHPPTPHYAVSSSDQIPRGYVAHARNACASVDYQWDSSRPPQDWGDGGEYGEEWSSMHKRFRRGLNHLISWYSQHGVDDRGEDALGFEQADRHAHEVDVEEEKEDLVVILVTHGAGSNALIGALTGQPVLLDVGMASLTMAVRRENAPPFTPSNAEATTNGYYNAHRRGSLDMGLNSIYEMKLISSLEHLRPGADPTRAPSTSSRTSSDVGGANDAAVARFRQRAGMDGEQPVRSNTSSALGTIRRPSATSLAVATGSSANRSSSMPPGREGLPPPPMPSLNHGLWTPPTSRTPLLQAEVKDESAGAGDDLVLDFSNSPPDSRPSTSGKGSSKDPPPPISGIVNGDSHNDRVDGTSAIAERSGGSEGGSHVVIEQPEKPGDRVTVPQLLERGLSQKGLWGKKLTGDKV